MAVIMPEIHHIIVQIRPANPKRNDPGQKTDAAYTVDGDTVTLVDRQGVPVRDADGKLYQHKVAPGTADAESLAHVLTKEFRRALKGNAPRGFSGGGGNSFGGPISYPRSGWR
jgi:hypothetical protein